MQPKKIKTLYRFQKEAVKLLPQYHNLYPTTIFWSLRNDAIKAITLSDFPRIGTLASFRVALGEGCKVQKNWPSNRGCFSFHLVGAFSQGWARVATFVLLEPSLKNMS